MLRAHQTSMRSLGPMGPAPAVCGLHHRRVVPRRAAAPTWAPTRRPAPSGAGHPQPNLQALLAGSAPAAARLATAAAAAPTARPTSSEPLAALSVLEYSAEGAADEWSRRPVPVVARLLEIATAFSGWGLRAALHRDPQRAAADMREVLVALGPAFVKIGQALSSRPDVMPPEYIEELELLQDRIPPFPNDQAFEVIEEELGMPWTAVFSSLSPSPVAAASLGQVYRGRLAEDGSEVAVKVQRPGVVEAIGRDTFILRHLAGIARQQLKLNTDLPALVDEWAASLFKELDYRREAANATKFARLFSFMPEVVVPRMHTRWTTPRVLVMEWIEGERLRSASRQATGGGRPGASSSSSSTSTSTSTGSSASMIDADRAADDLRLVEIGVRCSLEQMLEEGFYHADPHPGNLLRTSDGRLGYLDFGMMGSIEPPVRQALIRATLHLVNREFDRLAEDFVALGLLPPGSDMSEVVPALTGVFQAALAGGVSNLSFGALSTDLGRTMYRYSFRLPPYYTLLVRSLSVLEGIALASDPNYKVLGAAYPWVSRRLLLTTNSSELTATLDNLLYDSQGRFNFERLESLLQQAAKARVAAGGSSSSGSGAPQQQQQQQQLGPGQQQQQQQQQQQRSPLNSLAAAVGAALAGPQGSELLVSSLQLLSPGSSSTSSGSSSSDGSSGSSKPLHEQRVSGRGSAAAAAGGPLALLLSPEASHIREILEDELAKGLDAAWRLGYDQTLDAASQQLEGWAAAAAASPLGSRLLPPALQPPPHSSGTTTTSTTVSSSTSSGSAITSSSSRPDLIESLLSIPRLAGADDRAQVDGLSRLAVQLAAFSSPPPPARASSTGGGSTGGSITSSAGSSSSSSSSNGRLPSKQQQQQQQQQLTPQQAANAAALQQVHAAAQVLRWLTSEVQLLSPEARREALAIPVNIVSKLGSRLAARAVRAVLSPPPLPPATPSQPQPARWAAAGGSATADDAVPVPTAPAAARPAAAPAAAQAPATAQAAGATAASEGARAASGAAGNGRAGSSPKQQQQLVGGVSSSNGGPASSRLAAGAGQAARLSNGGRAVVGNGAQQQQPQEVEEVAVLLEFEGGNGGSSSSSSGSADERLAVPVAVASSAPRTRKVTMMTLEAPAEGT